MKNQIRLILAATLLMGFQSCEMQNVKPVMNQQISKADDDGSLSIYDANKRVVNYTAHLVGDEEVPAVETNAVGQVKLKLNADGTALHYKLIVANIRNVLASHIHLGSLGESGPVVAPLFLGPPVANPDGVLAEGMISASDVIGPLAGSLSDLIAAINSGQTYVNVHTIQVPSGEIRGQVR